VETEEDGMEERAEGVEEEERGRGKKDLRTNL
jgi:hypothetical protein